MNFKYGLKRGLPIAIGYFPVSFTFGLMAVSDGMPVYLAVLFSLTNVTSAGQFAGEKLICLQSTYIEMILTTLVINLRYTLMSLSLTQKLNDKFSFAKRMIVSFGITDEIFTVASLENEKITFTYMLGLISGPVAGWTLGTLAGALISNNLPEIVASSMGIALYGMFIAIIIPPAKKSKKICIIIAVSVGLTCIMKYVPVFSFISSGFRVIIATIIASGAGAFVFPVDENLESKSGSKGGNKS